MKSILLVALGGALGSVTRFKISGWILHNSINWRFPLSTFMVNMIGCLVIGLLAGLAAKDNFFSENARVFLFTGIVGGFTTFSAFELDAFFLLKKGDVLVAGGYLMLSIFIGLLALWIGFSLIPNKS